jgi:transposase InsO family protein
VNLRRLLRAVLFSPIRVGKRIIRHQKSEEIASLSRPSCCGVKRVCTNRNVKSARSVTLEDEVIAWLLWYNQTRMHSTLNYVSPVQFEQDWMDATVKIAA